MTFLELQREGRKKMDSTLKWYFFDFFYDAINIIEKIPQNEYNPFTCIADVDYEKCEAGMIKWPDLSEDITTFEQDFDVMLKTCNGYEGIIASEINENNDCQTVIIKFDISFFND